jgi:hypothetical protein
MDGRPLSATFMLVAIVAIAGMFFLLAYISDVLPEQLMRIYWWLRGERDD